jgi:glycosyltransferase involved in cell wall biosynthesis
MKLVYVGGLESMRGLETAIRALPILLEHVPKALLVVVGAGESQSRLTTLALQLGVDDQVLWAGWAEQKFVPGIIAAADVGLIPHYVTAHTNTTVPNKIFDYMAQGKPVVVTQAKSLSDIVSANRCGLVYEDRAPATLAAQLARLKDPELRMDLGRNGARAVRERFNWAVDRAVLLEAVECVAKSPQRLN